jgi:hypothetical protein
MYKEQITASLLKATLLVTKFLKNEYSLQEFVSNYGNFFYYEALDGHEANEEQQKVLDNLKEIIDFHKKIQLEVVDRVYFGNHENLQLNNNGGRVIPEKAEIMIKKLSQIYDVDKLINKLEK